MSDLHARALALFDDYLELPAPDRARAMEALILRDRALSAAVQSLFDADNATRGGVLDQSPADLIAARHLADRPVEDEPDTNIGARLGAWRIDRLVASGGMGNVYEAHRDDGEYGQRVALKRIRADLATPALVSAFRDERNLLARLDHPNIAGLVDGGVDGVGQPWFAMRFLEGEQADAWCDARRATVRERVELLIQACDALAYAHAQGVVHGDIKPSNLLVKEDGQAQLIDFGISSLLGAGGERVAITRDYAAPEMLAHGVQGPATDIYAVGVLMYRLLCGQGPTPAQGWRELLPTMPVGEVPPMDRLLMQAPLAVAQQRGIASVAALRRLLAGDLAAIASKAIAALPQDRYASASEMAGDLRRWREHRPLLARPGGWSLRARKWLRRNRLGAGLAATLLVYVGGGLAVVAWQREHALRNAQAAATVNQLFASTLGTATLSGLGNTPFSSQRLLDRTERELRKLHVQTQPALFARSLATLARGYATIGDYRKADRLADEAQRMQGDSAEQDGFVAATHLAMLNIQARHREAVDVALQEIASLGDSDEPPTRRARAILLSELAKAHWGLGETQQALDTLNQALEQARVLRNSELSAQLLMLRSEFGMRLFYLASAQSDAERAIALVTPNNPILADDAREQLMKVLQRRQSREALPLAERLLRDRRATLGERHPKTAWAWIRLGNVQPREPAAKSVRKGLELIEAAYGPEHPDYASASATAAWYNGKPSRERIAMMRASVRTLERTLGPRNELTLSAKGSLGGLLLDPGPTTQIPPDEIAEGFALLEAVIQDKRRNGIPTPWEQLVLGHDLVLRGDASRLLQAEELLAEAATAAKHHFGPRDAFSIRVALYRDKLLFRQGHYAKADLDFARRIDADREFLANPRTDRGVNDRYRGQALYESLMYRAFHAYQTCNRPEAAAFAERALRLSRAVSGPVDEAERILRSFTSESSARIRVEVPIYSMLVSADELAAVNRRASACPRTTSSARRV